MLRLLSEMQRVHCLLIVRQSLGHGTNDGCLRVTTEGRLKNSRHLAITVVNERLSIPLRKLIDYVGKGQKTPIDIASFTKANPISLRLLSAFTTGQID